MKLILSFILLTSASMASETQSMVLCESVETSILDASLDGTDDLTPAQFCSEYPSDQACIQALKLSCDLN